MWIRALVANKTQCSELKTQNLKTLCYINNRFLDYSEAKLHVSDIGLQRGYGIFDYFVEMNGRIPFLEDYLDRFYRSAEMLNMEVPLEQGNDEGEDRSSDYSRTNSAHRGLNCCSQEAIRKICILPQLPIS